MQKEHTVGENNIYVVEERPEQESGMTSLVLVHGSFGAGWMWSMFVPMLTKAGYPVFVLDLRGHGKSGGSVEGTTMEDYVSDVSVVVAELGIQKPTIIGHSMGGLVALMYGAHAEIACYVGIGPSPSLEVQKTSEEKSYPASYTPLDAGMPADPMEAMKALPDLNQEMLMKMRDMLGAESGIARSERKKGISIPKEQIAVPTLFIGSELGKSVPFGVSEQSTKDMAEYYGGDYVQVAGATHPGILAGEHSGEAVEVVLKWLGKK